MFWYFQVFAHAYLYFLLFCANLHASIFVGPLFACRYQWILKLCRWPIYEKASILSDKFIFDSFVRVRATPHALYIHKHWSIGKSWFSTKFSWPFSKGGCTVGGQCVRIKCFQIHSTLLKHVFKYWYDVSCIHLYRHYCTWSVMKTQKMHIFAFSSYFRYNNGEKYRCN